MVEASLPSSTRSVDGEHASDRQVLDTCTSVNLLGRWANEIEFQFTPWHPELTGSRVVRLGWHLGLASAYH